MNLSPIALITDTHLGARSNCEHVNAYFLKFFSSFFFPVLKERGVKTVIHLGDLGQYKKQVNTKILHDWTSMVFEPLKDYTCYFIVGNHDCYYKQNNSINLHRALNLEQNYGFAVIDSEVMTLPEYSMDLLPWLSTEIKQSCISSLSRTTSKYLLGHLEFISIETPYSESQLTFDFLKKYEKVFSGHFHTRTKVFDHVYYIGNPYPITWGDYGQDRGFSLFYPETGQLEFIKNPLSLFRKITFQGDEEMLHSFDFESCAHQHIKLLTKVDFEHNSMLTQFLEKLEEVNPLSLTIEKEELLVDNVLNMESYVSKNMMFYIEKYLELLYNSNTKLNIDKERLLKLLHSIYIKSLQLEL